MKIKQFKEECKRTCASLGNDKLDLSHMILGMVSELEELDESLVTKDIVNTGEEVADIYWYLMNYISFRELDIKLEQSNYNNYRLDSNTLVHGLSITISKLSDLTKKYIAYSKYISSNKEVELILKIDKYLQAILLRKGLDLGNVLQNNIDKLKIRFPEKFNENEANNRNLTKERKELEK